MVGIVRIKDILKKEIEGLEINIDDVENTDVILKCENCKEPNYFIFKDGSGLTRECSCLKQEKFYNKIKKFRDISILDNFTKEKTFAETEVLTEKERTYCDSFLKFVSNYKDFKGKGYKLILTGFAGTGKTHYTSCIYNSLKKQYKIVNFNLSRYLAEIKKSDNFDIKEKELLDIIKESDLIIIDDVGSENISESWGKEKIYNLMDLIYRSNINLVMSTNLKKSDFDRFMMFNGSDKIVDRLKENSKSYVFDWKSRRNTNPEDIPF